MNMGRDLLFTISRLKIKVILRCSYLLLSKYVTEINICNRMHCGHQKVPHKILVGPFNVDTLKLYLSSFFFLFYAFEPNHYLYAFRCVRATQQLLSILFKNIIVGSGEMT